MPINNPNQPVPAVLQQVASSYPLQRRYASGLLPLHQALTVRDSYKVAKLGGDFLKPEDLRRAYGAESKRWVENLAGYVDITCNRYTIESAVDWAELNGAEDVIKRSLLIREARLKSAYEKLLNSIEYGQVATLTNPASYNGNTATLTGAAQWDHVDCDVVASIETYKKAIKEKIGVYPNHITISEPVWNKLKVKKNLLDKLPVTTLRAGLTPEDFGKIIGIPNVVIADTMLKLGGALAYPWAKSVVFAYNPVSIIDPEHEPVFGITIIRPLGYADIRSYEDNGRTSDVVAVDRFLGWGIVTPEAGFLLQNVVS